MALTEEEREKIIEEETLRAEIRNEKEKNPIDEYAEASFGAVFLFGLAFVGYFLYAVYFK